MSFKYKQGDLLIKLMKRIGLININSKDPTMYKMRNGNKKHFWVDTIWTTPDLRRATDIVTKFDDDYNHSDHYPGRIMLQDLLQQRIKSKAPQIMKHWKIKDRFYQVWNEFREFTEKQMKKIKTEIDANSGNAMTKTRTFVSSLSSTTMQILVNSAQRIIGERNLGLMRNC